MDRTIFATHRIGCGGPLGMLPEPYHGVAGLSRARETGMFSVLCGFQSGCWPCCFSARRRPALQRRGNAVFRTLIAHAANRRFGVVSSISPNSRTWTIPFPTFIVNLRARPWIKAFRRRTTRYSFASFVPPGGGAVSRRWIWQPAWARPSPSSANASGASGGSTSWNCGRSAARSAWPCRCSSSDWTGC